MADEGTLLIQDLMRFLPDGMTANGWAVRAGVSRTIWADMRRHGNPSRRTLEKLLAAAGSSLAEFEALRIGQLAHSLAGGAGRLAESGRGWRAAPLIPMPLLATSLAGEWGEAESGIEMHSIDWAKAFGRVDRPAALAADAHAYAVTVAGKSMWPRFRSGRRLLVSAAAPIRVGDDVLVRLADDQVLIKELVRQSAVSIQLRQFNPDVTFAVETAGITSIHRIMGEAI
jgi:SOS-response transcriptional repressor LexA